MKIKKILLSLVSIVFLTSCFQRSLREDIKEFVANFSLEESVKAYLVAGYVSENTVTKNGTTTKVIETFDFDVSDVRDPHYHKNVKTYVDNVLSEEDDEYIVHQDDTFFYHHNDDEAEEYTLEQCHVLVRAFFYTQVEAEGTYHIRGQYYGDYVLQSCLSFQNFITIDQENELYIFEASQIKASDDGKVNIHQKYEVNKLGMLVTNDVTMVSNNINSHIHIDVTKS